MMAQAKQGYLATLDGWRAIAIIAVVVDHEVGLGFSGVPHSIFSLTRVGPNGVSLFFAISGFLICSRLLEEKAATGRISMKGFYIRRATRILPPAVLYLGVIGLLATAGIIRVGRLEWMSSVFFFRNYLPPELIPAGWGAYTIHYWSLAVEEHFYLLWPTILVLSGPKGAKLSAGGLALIVALWRSWEFRHQVLDAHVHGLLFGSRTDVRLDGLLLGCLAALFLADPATRSWLHRLMKWRVWLLCVIAYVGLQFLYRRHYYTLGESALLAFIVATTVVRPDNWIGGFLELGWMRWIGRLSYSLYLWQQIFLAPGATGVWMRLQRFPLNCILLFTVAGLSYRFIERPMIRLGHKLAPPASPGRQDIENESALTLGSGVPKWTSVKSVGR